MSRWPDARQDDDPSPQQRISGAYPGGAARFDSGIIRTDTSIEARGGDVNVTALLQMLGDITRLNIVKSHDGSSSGRLMGNFDGSPDFDINGTLRSMTAEQLVLNLKVDFLTRIFLKSHNVSLVQEDGTHGTISMTSPSGSVQGQNETIQGPELVYTHPPA